MQDTKNALARLADAIRGMDDYQKGRLIGIGEGMILAGIKSQPGGTDAQRAVLGLQPKESA